MDQWLTDPIIQRLAVPALVSFVAAAMLGFGPGRLIGARSAAAAAIPIGFLAYYWLSRGWPSFPPAGASQKIAYIVLAGCAGGALLDIFENSGGLRRLGAVVWPAAIVGWLHWQGLTASPPMALIVPGALWVGGMAVFSGLQESYISETEPAVKLMIAALGACLIALIGSSPTYAYLLLALAAAAGGFVFWNLPVNRFFFNDAAVYGGTGAFLSLTAVLVLSGKANRPALLVLVLVFFADRIMAHLPIRLSSESAPWLVGAVSLVIAAAAIWTAHYYGAATPWR